MGAWSVSLYGNDAAADLKGDFAVFVRIPGDAASLVARLKARYPDLDDPRSEDYSDLWLALADRLHAYGLDDAETRERARALIDDGVDLAAKAALGMGARDLDKRRAVLDGLRARWREPAAKPKPRGLLKAPEPHLFAPGDIFVYPTSAGSPGNPWFRRPEDFAGWIADGWGSAIVLATGHVLDYFAWTAIGRLAVHGAAKPDIAACRDSAIENQPWPMNPDGEGTLAVETGALPRPRADRMRLALLGRVDLDAARVKAHCPMAFEPPRAPPPLPMSVLRWWDAAEARRALELQELSTPRPAVALSMLRASAAR